MYYNIEDSGKRISDLRIQYGMVQEELAERLGIAVNSLSRIEKGHRGISIDLAVQIAEFFDVSLDFIILGRSSQSEETSSRLSTVIAELVDIKKKL